MNKNLRIILLGFIIISFQHFSLTAQNFGKITGRVLDSRTGAPLRDVNVYLANTTIGTSTNAVGRYTLEKVPVGNYYIVLSSVGYERKEFSMVVKKNQITSEIVYLKSIPVQLPEVIVDFDEEWQKNFEIFKSELLGKTSRADDCEITNVNYLKLYNDENGKLIAKSDSLITVINNSLGYKIDLLIEKFSWDAASSIGNYVIYPIYQAMESASSNDSLRWNDNRKKAYLGSFRHFLYAVAHDSVAYSNYAVYKGNVADFIHRQKEPAPRRDWEIQFGSEYVKFCLGLPHLIENGYLENMSQLELKLNRNCVIIPTECLLISYNGILLNPDKVQLSGYWANQRIADALPYDYVYVK